MSERDQLLEGRRVLIGTPAYQGWVHQEYVNSLMSTRDLIASLGGSMEWGASANIANHVRLRNRLVALAMEKDVTDLVFIDADVSWDPGDLVQLLLWDDLDVVGVAPRANIEAGQTPFGVRFDGDDILVDPDRRLVQTNGIATAMLRISRSCLDQMIEHYGPSIAYYETGMDMHALFDAGVFDGAFWSEDYLFCKRWESMGGLVWAAAGMQLRHHKQVPLTGALWDHMEDDLKAQAPQPADDSPAPDDSVQDATAVESEGDESG